MKVCKGCGSLNVKAISSTKDKCNRCGKVGRFGHLHSQTGLNHYELGGHRVGNGSYMQTRKKSPNEKKLFGE